MDYHRVVITWLVLSVYECFFLSLFLLLFLFLVWKPRFLNLFERNHPDFFNPELLSHHRSLHSTYLTAATPRTRPQLFNLPWPLFPYSCLMSSLSVDALWTPNLYWSITVWPKRVTEGIKTRGAILCKGNGALPPQQQLRLISFPKYPWPTIKNIIRTLQL